MEKNYELIFEIYGTGIRLSITTDYANGIEIANQMSRDVSKKWTRHENIGGSVNHMDVYFDIYNEGSIILKRRGNGTISTNSST